MCFPERRMMEIAGAGRVGVSTEEPSRAQGTRYLASDQPRRIADTHAADRGDGRREQHRVPVPCRSIAPYRRRHLGSPGRRAGPVPVPMVRRPDSRLEVRRSDKESFKGEPLLDQRSGRTNEPDNQGSDGAALLLRDSRSVAMPSRQLRHSLQLRQRLLPPATSMGRPCWPRSPDVRAADQR